MLMTRTLVLCAALVPVVAGAVCYRCEHRSSAARAEFQRHHPCPANGHRRGPCPGYVVDHIDPLVCGGADDPSNMAWQTVEAAKAKDRWEAQGCRDGHR